MKLEDRDDGHDHDESDNGDSGVGGSHDDDGDDDDDDDDEDEVFGASITTPSRLSSSVGFGFVVWLFTEIIRFHRKKHTM